MFHVALYGNRGMLRDICPECRRQAFILDGKFACCDLKVDVSPTQRVKRETHPEAVRRLPSLEQRTKQLELQEHSCFYCFRLLGSYVCRTKNETNRWTRLRLHWDHQVPYVLTQNNQMSNFVASCHVCNGIKAAFLFQTIEEARIYVQAKRKEKGYL